MTSQVQLNEAISALRKRLSEVNLLIVSLERVGKVSARPDSRTRARRSRNRPKPARPSA